MTKAAQQALHNLMKDQSNTNVRFCLICNYISKLEKPVQEACMSFKFNSLPKKISKEFLQKIVEKEKIKKCLGPMHNILSKITNLIYDR